MSGMSGTWATVGNGGNPYADVPTYRESDRMDDYGMEMSTRMDEVRRLLGVKISQRKDGLYTAIRLTALELHRALAAFGHEDVLTLDNVGEIAQGRGWAVRRFKHNGYSVRGLTEHEAEVLMDAIWFSHMVPVGIDRYGEIEYVHVCDVPTLNIGERRSRKAQYKGFVWFSNRARKAALVATKEN
jgi:hypothetical protein